MPYTQADLDALDAEIAQVRLVEETAFSDQRTRFRSIDDILKLRSVMAASVAGASRTRYAAHDKGV